MGYPAEFLLVFYRVPTWNTKVLVGSLTDYTLEYGLVSTELLLDFYGLPRRS